MFICDISQGKDEMNNIKVHKHHMCDICGKGDFFNQLAALHLIRRLTLLIHTIRQMEEQIQER